MNKHSAKHKNKTLATLLAVLLGGPGVHRFYLYGAKDFWAWNYVIAFALFVCANVLVQSDAAVPAGISFLAAVPLAIFAGWVEAFAIGLTPDKKWDAQHHAGTPYQSASGWPVIALLALAACGALAVLAVFILHLSGLILKSGVLH
jgi:TM2 domain-containing membrane protein YozV